MVLASDVKFGKPKKLRGSAPQTPTHLENVTFPNFISPALRHVEAMRFEIAA